MQTQQNLILVGRNRLGRRLVCRAVRRGWSVQVVTHDSTTYKDPCGECRDIGFIDAGDWTSTAVVEAMEGMSVSPDTVFYSTVDQRIGLASELAGHFGTHRQTEGNGSWAADKWSMSQLLRQARLPVPRSAVASSLEEARQLANEAGFPVVLKPRDMNGSQHVRFCQGASDVDEAWSDHAGDLIDPYHDLRFSPDLLVQSYVPGPLYSVETLSAGGRVVVLGVTDRILSPLPFFAEVGAGFPVLDGLSELPLLHEMAAGAVRTLGILGPAHTEIVIGPQGPVIIEVNARSPGGPVPNMIQCVTGVDILEAILDVFSDLALPPPPAHRWAAASAEAVALPARTSCDEDSPREAAPLLRDNRDGGVWIMACGSTLPEARQRLSSISRVEM